MRDFSFPVPAIDSGIGTRCGGVPADARKGCGGSTTASSVAGNVEQAIAKDFAEAFTEAFTEIDTKWLFARQRVPIFLSGSGSGFTWRQLGACAKRTVRV